MKTKAKIILISILSALLLAGCNKETQLIDKPETEGSAVSLTQDGSTEIKKIIDTYGETQYILGGETEATVSETESADTDENDAEPIAEISWKILDFGAIDSGTSGQGEWTGGGNSFVKDGIFCTDYTFIPDKESEEPQLFRLRFYDISEEKLLAEIDVPDGWGPYEMITEVGEDLLCRYIISYSVFNEESGFFDTDYKTVTVKNDFSYDIADGYAPQDVSREVCGHNIAERAPDIIDADSGEILAEGNEDTSELRSTSIAYYFPVDKNRFVYRIVGYEKLPGFGIYDFSAGQATDIPNTDDLIPLGVHGGKIYSVKTQWDGYGTELYVTDTETFETEFFWDFPDEVQANDYIEYAMPESGNYIAMKYLPADESKPAALYAIDPDTKEFIVKDIPDELRYYALTRSSGNYVTVSNNGGKVLIAEAGF